MKQFMYALLTSKKDIISVYSSETVVNKIKPEIEKLLGDSLTVEKVMIDMSISLIKDYHDRSNNRDEEAQDTAE